jgi:hypothetical protein
MTCWIDVGLGKLRPPDVLIYICMAPRDPRAPRGGSGSSPQTRQSNGRKKGARIAKSKKPTLICVFCASLRPFRSARALWVRIQPDGMAAGHVYRLGRSEAAGRSHIYVWRPVTPCTPWRFQLFSFCCSGRLSPALRVPGTIAPAGRPSAVRDRLRTPAS